MNKSIFAFVALCGGIACALVYLNKQHTAPATPTPVAETPASQAVAPAPAEITPTPKSATSAVAPAAASMIPAQPTAPAMVETKPADAANLVHQKVDALLSAKSGADKQAAFADLVKSGHIDDGIAELKQRAADNPTDAKIPTTLGEAQLNKLRALREAAPTADNTDDMGILAMQADQSFNTALKIDPQNWEAQFVKTTSMTYWPSEPARDSDIIQRFSTLIDQQESMTPNPAFAQSYVMLGAQYQKIGQPDKAQATWQLGLTKFPNDPTLQKKLNGQ